MSDDPSDLDGLVRRVDPDRWMSSRFIADPGQRADAIALYAFDYELARAPRVASNPLLGEIRLTWWREVLDEAFEGRTARRHPTAEALAAAIRRHDLPRAPLEAMIDARYRELDPTPMTAEEARAFASETAGGLAALVARILDPDADPEAAHVAGAVWALRRRGEPVADLVTARTLSAAAFPAIAHAAMPSDGSELARRVRLLWAVLRGRV
ncbi:squalene/phytoene synthase family protein [Phenylobacterium sp.]|jgi:phytoene synthase|uniref:squalene/phytoene synthase family protein n=1 Tax=Phenylobacterium sp. TaxID=1871053 RepID=UPI003784A187